MRWLAGAVLALFLAPAAFLLHKAVAPGEIGPLLRLADTVLPGYLGNSLLIAGIAGGLAGLVGVAAAFLVVFFEFPGRRWLDAGLVLPLVLPPYLVAICYREAAHGRVGLPPVDTPIGAGVILALTLYPFVYLLVRAAFRRQALGYIEIGKSLGLTHAQIARRALLPLARPAILLGTLLVVVEALSDYGTASVLGVHTLTTAVYRVWFSQFDETLAAQVALVGALIPLLLVAIYALLTRGMGFESPSNRPRSPRRARLGSKTGWLALVLGALPVLLGFLVPVLILSGWALDAIDRVRLDGLYRDLLNTLFLAFGTSAITLAIGLWLALLGRGVAGRGWSLATLWVLSLAYALPAILLAIALLFLSAWSYQTTIGGWVANSIALVLLATTMRFTCFAYFGAETGLVGVSRRVDEALRCVGRGRLYGLVRVILPLIRGPLTVGALLVFVMAAKELTLSLVLQPFGYGSLALSIYEFAGIDLYQPAAVHALCLALVVVYPVLSINRWLGARSG